MGAHFKATLFYGMPVGSDRGWDLVEDVNSLDGPLEVADMAPETGSEYMLFVRESYKRGDEWSDAFCLKLSDIAGSKAEWRQLIVDACIAHGLTFVEPDWYFATMFS